MQEIWKDIYFEEKGVIWDYRGLYQVSNLGRIKSLPRNGTKKSEKILSTKHDKYGYVCIDLYKQNKSKTFKVHRLMGKVFIPNPDNLSEINHKNKIRDCNIINMDDLYGNTTNLEWCTNEYNIRYSRAKKVTQHDEQGNVIKKWDCIRTIEKELGICNGDIVKCCKGKQKTAGGYIWRYATEN